MDFYLHCFISTQHILHSCSEKVNFSLSDQYLQKVMTKFKFKTEVVAQITAHPKDAQAGFWHSAATLSS